MVMDREALFERICSVENMFLAFEKFSAGKHAKFDVMAFERLLEDNLFALRDEILSGAYRHSPYEPFTVFDPKERQIHKATVKDRVVHQAVVNVFEPLFDRHFIHDSYSCRIGKGTHAAVNRLRHFLAQVSRNNTRTVYALKCDVRKFFASVDHRILNALLKRRISDELTMQLLKNIISSFSMGDYRGIPLGNLTSQLFANIYLNELDRFIKLTLKEKFYLRYCDDFIILGEDRLKLLKIADKINDFLNYSLTLRLHPKKLFVRTWSQGIDFLGYVLLPNATILRPKTAKRMLKRVDDNNMSSYLGYCSHADSYDLRQLVLNHTLSLGY